MVKDQIQCTCLLFLGSFLLEREICAVLHSFQCTHAAYLASSGTHMPTAFPPVQSFRSGSESPPLAGAVIYLHINGSILHWATCLPREPTPQQPATARMFDSTQHRVLTCSTTKQSNMSLPSPIPLLWPCPYIYTLATRHSSSISNPPSPAETACSPPTRSHQT